MAERLKMVYRETGRPEEAAAIRARYGLAEKRIEISIKPDAGHNDSKRRPEDQAQRSLPLWQRQKVQEMLRAPTSCDLKLDQLSLPACGPSVRGAASVEAELLVRTLVAYATSQSSAASSFPLA